MKKRHKLFGISVKISLISGVIVLVLLTGGSVLLLNSQSNLLTFITQEYLRKIEASIEHQGNHQQETFEHTLSVLSQIAGELAARLLYSIDDRGLSSSLTPYMKLPEILAIEVLADRDTPFTALWKAPELQQGKALPLNYASELSALSLELKAEYEGIAVGKIRIFYTDTPLADAIQQSKIQARADIETLNDTINTRIHAVFRQQIIGVLCVILVLIVTISMCLRIIAITPIKKIVKLANAVASGDFSQTIDVHQQDEIGELAEAFRTMRKTIRQTLTAIHELIQDIQNGKLRTASDVETCAGGSRQFIVNTAAFQGSWQELVTGINTVIGAFMTPFNVTADYIERISRGEIPDKLTEDFRGDFQEIQYHLNMLIDAMAQTTHVAEGIAEGNLDMEVIPRSGEDRMMQALQHMVQRLNSIIAEMRVMIQAVEEGNLDIRGNADKFKGGWYALITRMNALLNVFSSAVADNAAMTQEMALAHKIQTAILPKGIQHDDLEIEAIMLPAEEVGGDYYDMLYGADGHLWIGIGDVSGHGVTPGLIMMMAQTIKTTITTHMSVTPRDVLNMTNTILYHNVHERLGENHFMTFIAMKYLGKGMIEHAAGAHNDPMIFRHQTGTCEQIKSTGMWLNMIPDITHITENATFTLNIGDVLVLYTDGLTEAFSPDGIMLDTGRFQDIIVRHADKPTAAMRDAILDDVLAWCDNMRADDMTLVLARRVK